MNKNNFCSAYNINKKITTGGADPAVLRLPRRRGNLAVNDTGVVCVEWEVVTRHMMMPMQGVEGIYIFILLGD